jgi:hypothetical protein
VLGRRRRLADTLGGNLDSSVGCNPESSASTRRN